MSDEKERPGNHPERKIVREAIVECEDLLRRAKLYADGKWRDMLGNELKVLQVVADLPGNHFWGSKTFLGKRLIEL
jgi:hypothetical protein